MFFSDTVIRLSGLFGNNLTIFSEIELTFRCGYATIIWRQGPVRRDGREVEGTGLENRRCESIRGFESHSLRQ